MVLLNDIRDVETAGQVAEKIAQSLAEPYRIGALRIDLSASIGISTYPQDELDAQALLRAADKAMYAAKRGGKRRVHFFQNSD